MTDKTAVVFEPHNDDLVIGMGGTALLLLDAGWTLSSVVLTDGRFGASDGNPERTAAVRVAEKEREVERLGMEWTNLDYPDQSLRQRSEDSDNRREILDLVSDAVERIDPTVAFVPAPNEGHRDHRAAHDLVTSALDETATNVTRAEYSVWTVPYLAPASMSTGTILTVGIDSVFDEKLSAIRLHKSQLREYPYDEIVTDFNGYLAKIYYPGGEHEYVELLHVPETDALPSGFTADIGAEETTSQFHR